MNYVYHQLFCISRFGLLVDCFKMIIFWFKGMELDEFTSDDILKTVLNKLRWLKQWKSGTPFKEDKNFFWLPSNGVNILKGSKYWRQIHNQGLKIKKILILK